MLLFLLQVFLVYYAVFAVALAVDHFVEGNHDLSAGEIVIGILVIPIICPLANIAWYVNYFLSKDKKSMDPRIHWRF